MPGHVVPPQLLPRIKAGLGRVSLDRPDHDPRARPAHLGCSRREGTERPTQEAPRQAGLLLGRLHGALGSARLCLDPDDLAAEADGWTRLARNRGALATVWAELQLVIGEPGEHSRAEIVAGLSAHGQGYPAAAAAGMGRTAHLWCRFGSSLIVARAYAQVLPPAEALSRWSPASGVAVVGSALEGGNWTQAVAPGFSYPDGWNPRDPDGVVRV